VTGWEFAALATSVVGGVAREVLLLLRGGVRPRRSTPPPVPGIDVVITARHADGGTVEIAIGKPTTGSGQHGSTPVC
jgi:hypothetical protein